MHLSHTRFENMNKKSKKSAIFAAIFGLGNEHFPTKKGSVAQLYRALDFGSSGWGLESLRGHPSGELIKIDWFSAFLFAQTLCN